MLPFEVELFRFGLCGTLIAAYGVADVLARRREGRARTVPKHAIGLKLVFTASLLGFYLLIAPTGGPLLGGAVNLAGIALAAVAMALRWRASVGAPSKGAGARTGLPSKTAGSPPDALAARMLFYVALPAATGVPWGWLVLTLPAWAASLYPILAAQALGESAPLKK